MRILSGIQSSGPFHIGNYYGAIRQWIALQNEGEALYFIADLHALTTVHDGATARALSRDAALALLALGLDPTKAILFRQSDVPEVLELYWLLGTLVPLSQLERAHSYKDKRSRGLSASFGLFAYPVLMAADILLYGTDVVPVGKDQMQHVEFARDWATRFNVAYVPGYDPAQPAGILTLPSARVQESNAVVPGTDGQKMSKSYGNTIDIFGDDRDVKKRIMGMKTDSTAVDAPKPVEGSALYQLLQVMAPEDERASIQSSWTTGGRGYGDYKRQLLDLFHATFDPARRRREELLRDPAEVERILQDGAHRARAIAAPVIRAVREVVGLG
jgi:tryptophanyl-tRNA synthetase